MHAMRLILPLLLTLAVPALAGPLRCAEDAEGGACVWGKAEGFEADSVQLRGLRIQVMGIMAPGPRDLCTAKAAKDEFPCNRPARKRMAELLAKGGVACELFDMAGDTLYGRCKVADGDLGRLLVGAGVVRSVKDGPYEAEQAAALAARKGLWAADMVPPKEWESARRRAERD